MKLAYQQLMDALEDYYLREIFKIRMDEDLRDNLKLARLDSIKESACRYKLGKVANMADNAMLRIINEI